MGWIRPPRHGRPLSCGPTPRRLRRFPRDHNDLGEFKRRRPRNGIPWPTLYQPTKTGIADGFPGCDVTTITAWRWLPRSRLKKPQESAAPHAVCSDLRPVVCFPTPHTACAHLARIDHAYGLIRRFGAGSAPRRDRIARAADHAPARASANARTARWSGQAARRVARPHAPPQFVPDPDRTALGARRSAVAAITRPPGIGELGNWGTAPTSRGMPHHHPRTSIPCEFRKFGDEPHRPTAVRRDFQHRAGASRGDSGHRPGASHHRRRRAKEAAHGTGPGHGGSPPALFGPCATTAPAGPRAPLPTLSPPHRRTPSARTQNAQLPTFPLLLGPFSVAS